MGYSELKEEEEGLNLLPNGLSSGDYEIIKPRDNESRGSNQQTGPTDKENISPRQKPLPPPPRYQETAWAARCTDIERKIKRQTQGNKQQTDTTDKENSSPQQEPIGSKNPPAYQSQSEAYAFLDSTNRRQPHAPQCRPHVDHEAKEKAKTLRQAETENVLQLLSLAKVAELQAEEPQAQTEENDFELAKRLQAEELEQESLRLAQQLAGNFSQEYRRLTEASSLPECSSVPLLLIMMIVPIFFVLYLIFAKRFRGAAKPRRSTQADGALPTWNAVSVKDRE